MNNVPKIFGIFGLLLITGVIAEDDPFAKKESAAEKAISDAGSQFFAGKSKLNSDYRVKLATAIAKGDRFQIFLLDFEVENTRSDFLFWDTRLEEDEFPIIPYGGKSKIIKRLELNNEQRKMFLPELREVIGFQGEDHGGAFCHFPIHGVRIFSEEQIIFQSSFCWKCSNFSISYPDAPAWVGIRGHKLFDVFSELMPIPQSELDRFTAKYGPKPEPTKTKAEQAGTGQPATSPESESEGSDKPQPESEGHSR